MTNAHNQLKYQSKTKLNLRRSQTLISLKTLVDTYFSKTKKPVYTKTISRKERKKFINLKD